MGSLKEDWKETGKDLGGAFKQLGKSIVKSGATVVNKARILRKDRRGLQ